MVNGRYGRLLPRLSLAVAEYVVKFGEWPTHASGSMLVTLLQQPSEESDPEDFSDFSPELAAKIRSRMICDLESYRGLIELRGPSGRSEGYGNIPRNEQVVDRAREWLYWGEP